MHAANADEFNDSDKEINVLQLQELIEDAGSAELIPYTVIQTLAGASTR
jgi:hypothetical protein